MQLLDVSVCVFYNTSAADEIPVAETNSAAQRDPEVSLRRAFTKIVIAVPG